MDEEFTTTAYPSVQENLKLPTEDQVILEEPASSAGTLSSLKNLDKELSFTNQFLVEKSQEDKPDKSNTEAEVQSMVMVPNHQDTSSVPLMTTLVIDLTIRLGNASSTTSSLQGSAHCRYEKLMQTRMFEDDSYKANNVYKDLYEALQKSLELDYSNQRLADQEEARKKRRKRRDAPRSPLRSPPSQPPPPPPLTDASCDPGHGNTLVWGILEMDIQEKEQKESQKQTNPSTEWKGQSQKSAK
ncbi:hypothetical protein Tco_0561340 [Tanacetum coccineum]